MTGGVDYDWRLGKRFSLQGHWAGSSVRGSAEAITDLQENNVHSFQRPDADHVDLDPTATLLNGHAGQLQFSKIAGERIRLSASIAYRSPGFEINDLGFLRRADEIPQFSWLQWRFDTPGRYVRTFRINFNQYSIRNFDGDRAWCRRQRQRALGVPEPVEHRLRREPQRARLRRSADPWRAGRLPQRQHRVVAVFQHQRPPSRQPPHVLVLQQRLERVARRSRSSPRIALRPTSSLSAELGLRWNTNKDDAQWIETLEEEGAVDRYLFGRLDQTTFAFTTRLNYTITPNLSLQLYGEPFVSSGHYEQYKELVAGRARQHEDRYAPIDHADDEDFSVLSFRTTNVLRWEFKPGSALFVVWQQSREGDGDDGRFRFGRDFRDVFSTGATNTLLVKLAYWLNP